MSWNRPRGPSSSASLASTTSRPAHPAAMPPTWRRGSNSGPGLCPAECAAWQSPPSPRGRSRARVPRTQAPGLKEGGSGIQSSSRIDCTAEHVGTCRGTRGRGTIPTDHELDGDRQALGVIDSKGHKWEALGWKGQGFGVRLACAAALLPCSSAVWSQQVREPLGASVSLQASEDHHRTASVFLSHPLPEQPLPSTLHTPSSTLL